MITPRRSSERGHADHGWLDTHHTFSFAGYRDPDFMGYGALRVLNQDVVAPGAGFGKHPHDNMEIVTVVLQGVLEHRDSMGNGSAIRPGEVQLMSAGTGVTHSEKNGSDIDAVEFLQMWVIPAERGTAPRYEQRRFPAEERTNRLCLVASPDGRDGSLTIGQDVRLFAATLEPGEEARLALPEGRRAWVHVARGAASVLGTALGPGDGAAIEGERELVFEGTGSADYPGGAELVLFDLA